MALQSLFAVSLLVPTYQASLDFYVGILGFIVIEDCMITAKKTVACNLLQGLV